MRELTTSEIRCVTGGTGTCTPANTGGADSPNAYLGGSSANSFGSVLIAAYEGAVAATSHIIERVANALGD